MRWVTELIFKNQTIQTFLEENTEKGLHNLSEGKYLRGQRNNYKQKNDKLDLLKVKNLCSLKDILKMNKQASD